jgi:hypothetical protein
MPGSEEEIYSIMFTSLKHPVRRKILRMTFENKVLTIMTDGYFLFTVGNITSWFPKTKQ